MVLFPFLFSVEDVAIIDNMLYSDMFKGDPQYTTFITLHKYDHNHLYTMILNLPPFCILDTCLNPVNPRSVLSYSCRFW